MKKTISFIHFLIATFFIGSILASCSKDGSSTSSMLPEGKQNLSIYLTDNPGFFDKVLIDIQSVEVLVDTCSSNNRYRSYHDTCNVWESLNFTPGIYNLLTLRNGADTLLAGSNIPAGEVSEIKLQLGPDDSLVEDSVSYPLHIRDSSVILITTNSNSWEQFDRGRFRLWLDFDVSRSIVQVSDNEFFLNPFIRTFTVSTTGSISGTVTPRYAFPVITVSNSSDTAYALPDIFGNFEVRGLNPGTYNLSINATNGYADTTITGINVTAGIQDQLGNIRLHK